MPSVCNPPALLYQLGAGCNLRRSTSWFCTDRSILFLKQGFCPWTSLCIIVWCRSHVSSQGGQFQTPLWATYHSYYQNKKWSWKWEATEFVQWSRKSCANCHCRLRMLPSEWHSKSSSLDSHAVLGVAYQRRALDPDNLIPVQLCYRHVYWETNLGEATHLIWLASVRFSVEMKPFTLHRRGSFALSLYITSSFHTERALGSGLSWRKAKFWIMIY